MTQAAPTVDPRSAFRLLALALLLGIVASAAAAVFMALVAWGQEVMFETLPGWAGWDTAPWWWGAIMLALGAGVVLLARRLPGATGLGPLTGFHFDDPPAMVPSVLLAALGTLLFGFVLGPEAPLIVLGTVVGALITRRADERVRKAAMFLAGAAAIGAVFGNPFVTAFMILEFAALGVVPAMLIAPTLVALGAGYLVQIGMWGLPGFGTHDLSVPGLPSYDAVVPGDLLLALVVAVVAAVVAVGARELGLSLDRVTTRRPVMGLAIATAATIVILGVAQGIVGVPQDLILFSGETGMGDLLAETSVVAVVVVLVGKALAYGVALGGGLRGGPVFPATFLGVAVGLLVTLILPGVAITPMVAAGIAASATAILRLPATSALLGMLLVGGGGAAVAPFAILGAIVGYVARLAVDQRDSRRGARASVG